ncbi:MAG: glycosyltransferase family 9 protein, partial [Armatimonadota bacterium]
DMLKESYNAESVLMGAPSDIPLVNNIVDLARNKPAVCAGKTTLKQAGAIIEKCRVSVGVDTGLLHMSVALRIPTIGIFGPSEWRGFMKRADFIWLAKEYECSPCRRHPICKDYDCMRAITSDDVKNAIKPWLEMSNDGNNILSSESAG